MPVTAARGVLAYRKRHSRTAAGEERSAAHGFFILPDVRTGPGPAIAIMNKDSSSIVIRQARMSDRNHLKAMQASSMRTLARRCYSREEIEAFITFVGTMDDQLIDEGTYSIAETGGRLVASGGWSRIRANYVSGAPVDHTAAKIRSVFVRPEWVRHGLGRMLMEHAEREAFVAGFNRVELNALLSGVPFYRALGYRPLRPIALDLPDGITFRGLTMEKPLGQVAGSRPAEDKAAPAMLAGCLGDVGGAHLCAA